MSCTPLSSLLSLESPEQLGEACILRLVECHTLVAMFSSCPFFPCLDCSLLPLSFIGG